MPSYLFNSKVHYQKDFGLLCFVLHRLRTQLTDADFPAFTI